VVSREAFEIGGERVAAGSQRIVELPLPPLYTHDPLSMPVHVIHGRRPGPVLFIAAAVHGDELNGVEIIQRLLQHAQLRKLRGTLLAVPVVNLYGLIRHSRYLPDRRDLNRSFPGSERGSLAGRLANIFMTEIVARADYGIDLHTGANQRENLPQIRADLDDAETERLARAFGVPVILNADLRDGSLRQAAREHGVRMLVYEAGEALRFNELCIRGGVRGVLRAMRALDMLASRKSRQNPPPEPTVARSSSWVRAPASGIFRSAVQLGAWVEQEQLLGRVADPAGGDAVDVHSPGSGIVIGRINIPLVHEGEALCHIARYRDTGVAQQVEDFASAWGSAPDAPFDDPLT